MVPSLTVALVPINVAAVAASVPATTVIATKPEFGTDAIISNSHQKSEREISIK